MITLAEYGEMKRHIFQERLEVRLDEAVRTRRY